MNRANVQPDELYSGGMAWWIAHEPIAARISPTVPYVRRERRVQTFKDRLLGTMTAGKQYDIAALMELLQANKITTKNGAEPAHKYVMQTLLECLEQGHVERFGPEKHFRYRRP